MWMMCLHLCRLGTAETCAVCCMPHVVGIGNDRVPHFIQEGENTSGASGAEGAIILDFETALNGEGDSIILRAHQSRSNKFVRGLSRFVLPSRSRFSTG